MLKFYMTYPEICKKLCLFFSVCAFLIAGLFPIKSYACCDCSDSVDQTLQRQWPTTQQQIEDRVTQEFTTLRTWYLGILWQSNLLPAMMLFTEQMTAVANYQTSIFGMFLDAKHQLENQRTLQKIRARAHKDYHPSEGLCEFGSTTKSLAASERRSELTAHVMSQRFQDRMLGNANTSGAKGPGFDKPARLKQFREKFCDPSDNNGGLDFLCEHDQDQNTGNSAHRSAAPGGIGGNKIERLNKDIDYVRTVDYPWTLNVDFSDATLTDNEEEILALADNLYGDNVFERISGTPLNQGGLKPVPGNLTGTGRNKRKAEKFGIIHQNYMDARAVLAKLSVAKNSFDAIVGMKAAGTPGSRVFMEAILTELGISGNSGGINNMRYLLGSSNPSATGTAPSPDIGPSYNAQMEILTKKIYQNPDFYTSLYDKPANVERKKVAMQAIGLMQKFDLFKSYLRYEASLSVLLELAVTDLQEKLEQKIGDQSQGGEE